MQNWNMTKKSNSISMQQFTNENEENFINPNKIISLQFDGRSPREEDNVEINCNSCSEKFLIIDQLQKELHYTNLEKHTLKDKLSNLQSDFEYLEKKIKKEEKIFGSINLHEKYQPGQKQRLYAQKGKDIGIHNHNVPEKMHSPCSSVYNTNEDDNLFSSQQNQTYKLLIDELNSIKQKSTNNPNDITLSDYQSSLSRQKSKTKDFIPSTDQSESKQDDLNEYFNSFNKKYNGVSQFSIPLNQQFSKNTDKSSKQKGLNPITLQKKNSQSESPTPSFKNKQQPQTNINQDNFLNKLIKPIPFCQIQFSEFGLKQNLKDLENETKSQNNKSQIQMYEFQQKRINHSNNNNPCQIDESIKTPTNNQNNSSGQDNQNFIYSKSENQNNSQIKFQLTNQVFDSNKINNSVLFDSEQLSSNKKSLKQEFNKKQQKNGSEQHIQQPLFDDLKDLMGIKDSQEFNLMFSKDSAFIKKSQNDKKQKQQPIFKSEDEAHEDYEEEKKEYIQQDQNASGSIYNQNDQFREELNTEQSEENYSLQVSQRNTKEIQESEKTSNRFKENQENEEEEQLEEDNQIQNDENLQQMKENNQKQNCRILKYSDKPRSIWIQIKQWIMLLILFVLSKVYGIFSDYYPRFLKSPKQ